MRKSLLSIIQDEVVEVGNVLGSLNKMQQITSGFVINEQGNMLMIDKARTPKMDALIDIIRMVIAAKEKILVWCNFKGEYQLIEDTFREVFPKPYNICRLVGGMGKKLFDNVDAFNNDVDMKVAICNRLSAGEGVNLTAAKYSVDFSHTYSLGSKKQSDRRNFRKGSEIHEHIVRMNIITHGTFDETIIKSIQNKESGLKQFISQLKKGEK